MISRTETAKGKKALTKANKKSRVALGDKSLRRAEKSAAERSLEEELFGNLQPPAVNKGKGRAALNSELVEGAGDNIADEQLFVIDNTSTLLQPDHDSTDGKSNEKSLSDQHHAAKPALWHDPADAALSVSLANDSRLRKLRGSAAEDVVSGSQYEAKLRAYHQKVNGTPAWASAARKRARADSEADADEDKLLQSTSAGLKRLHRSGPLPSLLLDVERVRDANHEVSTSAAIMASEFHPSSDVLFTASADRRLRLFQINGHTNPLLQSLHVPELPLAKAKFHPSGSTIILTGRSKPYYLTYNLQAGKITRSAAHLRPTNSGSMLQREFKFSPDGSVLAAVGEGGHIHLIDHKTSSTIGDVKANGAVEGLCWAKGGLELISLGKDSQIYVWDVRMQRCVGRWADEGGFSGLGMAGDAREQYVATSSSTGIVNLYSHEEAARAGRSGETSDCKPLKTITNLTTAATTLSFNHDSQLLALASNAKKDSLKMVHLPSMTVFSNWPTVKSPLGVITSVAFSKMSEYMAVGNEKGKVVLYMLPHFARK